MDLPLVVAALIFDLVIIAMSIPIFIYLKNNVSLMWFPAILLLFALLILIVVSVAIAKGKKTINTLMSSNSSYQSAYARNTPQMMIPSSQASVYSQADRAMPQPQPSRQSSRVSSRPTSRNATVEIDEMSSSAFTTPASSRSTTYNSMRSRQENSVSPIARINIYPETDNR